MAIYQKVGGEWVEQSAPHVKHSGFWSPAKTVYVKDSGLWKLVYGSEPLPPDVPLISIELVESTYWENHEQKTGRRLKIGVRSPLLGHDSNLKRIRVLSTYNDKPPTTQFGGTYTSEPDDNWANEPWSDFQFNGYGGSSVDKDSSVWRYKTWPRSANNSSQLQGQKTYYFTAWAESLDGNWSAANPASIFVPKKNVDGTQEIVKEARFQATNSGTMTDNGFKSGDLVQSWDSVSSNKKGVWLYNKQMVENIGAAGKAKIKKAQIYIQRRNDTGNEKAFVYLYWHEYGGAGSLPATIGAFKESKIIKLGQLTKGEGKWFDIPSEFTEKMENREVKGFGLHHKSPDKAQGFANDFSRVKGVDDEPRSGEVHVVWTEKP